MLYGPNDRPRQPIFAARLTEKERDDEGRWAYGWQMLVVDPVTGGLTEVAPPVVGAPDNSPAYEMNNGELNIPEDDGEKPVVWLRVRGVQAGQLVYEFSWPAERALFAKLLSGGDVGRAYSPGPPEEPFLPFANYAWTEVVWDSGNWVVPENPRTGSQTDTPACEVYQRREYVYGTIVELEPDPSGGDWYWFVGPAMPVWTGVRNTGLVGDPAVLSTAVAPGAVRLAVSTTAYGMQAARGSVPPYVHTEALNGFSVVDVSAEIESAALKGKTVMLLPGIADSDSAGVLTPDIDPQIVGGTKHFTGSIVCGGLLGLGSGSPSGGQVAFTSSANDSVSGSVAMSAGGEVSLSAAESSSSFAASLTLPAAGGSYFTFASTAGASLKISDSAGDHVGDTGAMPGGGACHGGLVTTAGSAGFTGSFSFKSETIPGTWTLTFTGGVLTSATLA